MFNKSAGVARVLAAVLVATSALSASGWFWWNAHWRSRVNFLPRLPPAEWMLYPSAPEGTLHRGLEMGTAFRRSFRLSTAPARATIRIAAFHHYSLVINGASPGSPERRGKNWKEPDLFEVSALLRPGENQIVVTVTNTEGPPALWFWLGANGLALTSGKEWEASFAGASWRAARLATKPQIRPVGSPFSGGERPGASLRKRWPKLLFFLALSAAGYWLITKGWTMIPSPLSAVHGPWRVLTGRDLVPVLGLAGLWILLFANNLGALPPSFGYDAKGHIDYIRYIQERHSLPLASEGWEMFQPPLYYLLSAGLLEILSLSVRDAGGITALRVMGVAVGVGHFVMVWLASRLLFPNQRARQLSGVALAAFLPPMLYLSQYITNEPLAAALVTASAYFCLLILKRDRASWKSYLGIGLCLGAALLTKMTALLAVPPICGALLWKAIRRASHQPGPRPGEAGASPAVWTYEVGQIALMLTACSLLCGWHYTRVWLHYGSPLIGVWDPRAGFSWYPDGGYQTAAYYFRFGEALRDPWYSGLHSFGDGIYSTLWGDSLGGGRADLRTRPPWDHELMAIGYWLSLLPSVAVLAGLVLLLVKFIQQPAPDVLMVLALGFVVAFAMVHMSMAVPYYCMIKAFYGLPALVPLCAFGATGLDWLCRQSRKLRFMLCLLFGVWAINSYSSFWISRSAVPSLVLRGQFLSEEGQNREAAELLRRALEIDPHNADARSWQATILASAGDLEEATNEAEIAVREASDEAKAHLTLANILARRQRFSEAVNHSRQAVTLAPGLGLAWEHLTAFLVQLGRHEEAVQASREGLASLPFSPVLRFTLGSALSARGELAEALARYRETIRLNPNFQEALNSLAWALATNPDPRFRDGAEAVQVATRACELTQYQHPEALAGLAAAYAETGRFSDAIAFAERAEGLARGSDALVERVRVMLNRFRAGRPYYAE